MTFHRGESCCFQTKYRFKLHTYLELHLIRYSWRQQFPKRTEVDVFVTTGKSDKIVFVFLWGKTVFSTFFFGVMVIFLTVNQEKFWLAA